MGNFPEIPGIEEAIKGIKDALDRFLGPDVPVTTIDYAGIEIRWCTKHEKFGKKRKAIKKVVIKDDRDKEVLEKIFLCKKCVPGRDNENWLKTYIEMKYKDLKNITAELDNA